MKDHGMNVTDCSIVQTQTQKPRQIAKFCSSCGGKIELAIPPGETEWRHVCGDCQTVTYYNPKMVSCLSHERLFNQYDDISSNQAI